MAGEAEAATAEVDGGGGRSKSRKSIFKRFRKKSSKKKTEEPEVPPEETTVEPLPVTPVKASVSDGDDDAQTASTASPPQTPATDGDTSGLDISHDGTPQMEEAAEQAEEDSAEPLGDASEQLSDASEPTEETAEPPQPPAYTKDGLPVVATAAADDFLPSEVRERNDDVSRRGESFLGGPHDAPSLKPTRSKAGKARSTVVLDQAPSAKDAAFGGPPRYDWIDIETAAAVKVQAAYRRNKVMWELEKQGKSTAAMRNRQRARNSQRKMMLSEDVPFPLACCGVGFLFGDATGEDQEVLEMHRKQEYEERKRQQEEREASLRKLRYRRKAGDQVVEEYEVVDPEGEE